MKFPLYSLNEISEHTNVWWAYKLKETKTYSQSLAKKQNFLHSCVDISKFVFTELKV